MKFLHWVQQGILALCLGALLIGGLAESQTATLNEGGNTYTLRQNGRKWQWESRGNLLNAATLMGRLNSVNRVNCFRELGRLILAQDLLLQHNHVGNSSFAYITVGNRNALQGTKTIKALLNHLFDHGHMGYYPHAGVIGRPANTNVVTGNPQACPRGIFNVSDAIRTRIFSQIGAWFSNSRTNNMIILQGKAPASQGYAVDLSPAQGVVTLQEAACNLVKTLFSSDRFNNITFGQVQWRGAVGRFTIDTTYSGAAIDGFD